MPDTKEKRIEIADAVATISARITSISMPLYRLAGASAPVPKSPEVLKAEQAETNRLGAYAARTGTAFERPGQMAMSFEGLEEVPRPLPKRDRHATAKKELAEQLEDAVWRSVFAICDDIAKPKPWSGEEMRKRCQVLSEDLKAKYYKRKKPSSVFPASSRPTPNDFDTLSSQLLTHEQRELIGAEEISAAISSLSTAIASISRNIHLPQDREPVRPQPRATGRGRRGR